MTPHYSLREVFDSLVDLDEGARSSRLSELKLSGPDSQRLTAMLAADSAAASLIPDSAERLIGTLGSSAEFVQQLIGTDIGSFRLIESIGEGGSSVVFRAERPVGDTVQTVALKLMFSGFYSSGLKRRSTREQSILAQLSHPNIARLIEAGATSAGIPYIAMEYVEGEPVTHHADSRALDLRQRLELVLALCSAIDAAHAALIVHCDLKPSNVFVDHGGTLKVLDFGVARLIDSERTGEHTRTIAFTPEYAAPEQFRPGPPTVAVDIYAIGVLLGELLTGARKRSGDGCVALSARVLDRGTADPPAGLPPRAALARNLRGDLDAIVAMATAEDPAARYRSVGALGADLAAYLAGRPVAARASTRGYRLRKFVRRNRAGVATSAMLLAALLGSVVYANWQAAAARRNAQAARAQAERADSMRNAVFEVLSEADPATPRDGDVTIVAAVDHAIDRLLVDTRSEARSRLELLSHFAETIGRQGQIDRARDVLQTAFDQATLAWGRDDDLALKIGASLTHFQSLTGRYEEARKLLDELLPRASAEATGLRVKLTMKSAVVAWRQRDFERAESEGRRAVELSRTSGDAEQRRKTLSDFGVVLLGIGRVAEAIPVFEEVLALSEAQLGPSHEKVALASSALARAYRRTGDLERSERFARRALDIDRAIYSGDHYVTAGHLNALAMTQRLQRNLEGSLASELERLRITRATVDAGHPDLRGALGSVGATLMLMERYAEARPYLLDALERERSADGSDRHVVALHRANLGFSVGMLDDPVQGAAELEQAIADIQALAPLDHALLATWIERRIRLALHLGDTTTALAWLERLAWAASQVAELDKAWWVGRVDTIRGAALLAAARPAEALLPLARASDALARHRSTDFVIPVEQQLLLAKAHADSGDAARARSLAASARASLQALPYPPSRLLQMARQLPQ